MPNIVLQFLFFNQLKCTPMSAKYKIVSRGNPSKPTATKKFYVQPLASGEARLKEIFKQIASMTTVNSADVLAVIDAFVQVIVQRLAKGEIVRLGDLGSLQMSFGSEGVDSADKFTASMIKGQKVTHRPDKEIKDMLKTVSFEKMS